MSKYVMMNVINLKYINNVNCALDYIYMFVN